MPPSDRTGEGDWVNLKQLGYMLLAVFLGVANVTVVGAFASAGHLWADWGGTLWDLAFLWAVLRVYAAMLWLLWMTRVKIERRRR